MTAAEVRVVAMRPKTARALANILFEVCGFGLRAGLVGGRFTCEAAGRT